MPSRISDGDMFIINFHDSKRKGSHWVALKVGKEGYYFDSFGGVPLDEVESVCKKSGLELIHNVYRIQDIDSKQCGNFCIDFLENVNDIESYNDWILNYSPNDYIENDKVVVKRLGLI